MPPRIIQPGFYYDMSAADYHADPAPAPSLRSSIAKTLIDRSPAHAWIEHPKLNPEWRSTDPTKYDVGNIAHAMMLGRGKEIVAIEFNDWRTKEAKDVRADAAKQGKLAVLKKDYLLAAEMVDTARGRLDASQFDTAFRDGDGEVVGIWQEGDLWFRFMADWICNPGLIYDFKTTGLSVAPHNIGKVMAGAGWDVQAAFIERGLDVLDPGNRGRRCFRFVAMEDKPPYAMIICQLPEAVMTMGRKKLAHAVKVWAECVRTDKWPAYPLALVYPEYPGWAESQWLERETAEFDNEILMAG